MNGEIRLLDEGVWPDPAHEGFFLDQLTVAPDENKQDINGLPGERHKLASAEEKVLRTVKAEAAEVPLEIFGPNHEDKPRI